MQNSTNLICAYLIIKNILNLNHSFETIHIRKLSKIRNIQTPVYFWSTDRSLKYVFQPEKTICRRGGQLSDITSSAAILFLHPANPRSPFFQFGANGRPPWFYFHDRAGTERMCAINISGLDWKTIDPPTLSVATRRQFSKSILL